MNQTTLIVLVIAGLLVLGVIVYIATRPAPQQQPNYGSGLGLALGFLGPLTGLIPTGQKA